MTNIKNIIYKRESFGDQSLLTASESMHIAFGIDVNFSLGMGILISSILMHNENKSFVFHVFTDEICQYDVDRLSILTQKYPNVMVKIYYVDKASLTNLPTGFVWTLAIYYRFIISEELYGIIDKVLYLDADILCVNSVEKIFQIDLKGNIIGAVEDLGDKQEVADRLFEGKITKYFASGLLLIDINKWKQENITQKLIEKLKRENNYKFFDQDVLNQVLYNKTKFMSEEYHYIYNVSFMKHRVPTNVLFIHFAGSAKPWHRWAQSHPLVQTYMEYKQKSLWEDVPIVEATNYKQAKFMARFYKRNKESAKALIWYLKYIIWRFTKKK